MKKGIIKLLIAGAILSVGAGYSHSKTKAENKPEHQPAKQEIIKVIEQEQQIVKPEVIKVIESQEQPVKQEIIKVIEQEQQVVKPEEYKPQIQVPQETPKPVVKPEEHKPQVQEPQEAPKPVVKPEEQQPEVQEPQEQAPQEENLDDLKYMITHYIKGAYFNQWFTLYHTSGNITIKYEDGEIIAVLGAELIDNYIDLNRQISSITDRDFTFTFNYHISEYHFEVKEFTFN